MTAPGVPWQIKSFRPEFKSADRGEVRAIFSRFSVVDGDGDWTEPGAFTDGAEIPISAYGHTSWQGALPVGKGVIRTDGQAAWVEAQFFMGTQAGRDHFETIKQLGPLQQWSYGFDVLDEDTKQVGGRRVRVLRKLAVHEVSPVLRGAGVRTVTLDAKELAGIRAGLELARIRTDLELAGVRDIRNNLEQVA